MLYLRKTQELAIRNLAARFLAGNRNYSRDYDSSDDEKELKKSQKPKKEKSPETPAPAAADESASAKLNRLLASMQTEDHMNLNKNYDVVPKPGDANKKKKLQVKQQAESKDIFSAAKRVASLLGEENKQQTESELLSKLLGGGKPTTGDAGAGDAGEKSKTSPESDVSLSDLIVGMKIDRRQNQKDSAPTRSEYVRRSIAAKGSQKQQYRKDGNAKDKRPVQRPREAATYTGSVNLFGGEPLGIFTEPAQLKESTDLLPTWSYLQEQSLKLQVSHPPNNYFDKIALWTEQGKVWRFPIDNEQDWTAEKDVDFSEHIFLEQHLEGWCPTRGPIRHFMELVCVGLSKNPYLTAKEKKDHILWYRDYFESKKDILKDLIAEDAKAKAQGAAKQVEA
ncbi:small ribosomal subunit protein mS31 [Musca vetustissima]|uniref:small ribosomal subunit protein mS31 n=1 Tax=Musca vetustissima TaxID=27455 RepID=UPI002AB747B8|nr:small ribosomal subunit protein mS31 [Musca vetustissima]